MLEAIRARNRRSWEAFFGGSIDEFLVALNEDQTRELLGVLRRVSERKRREAAGNN